MSNLEKRAEEWLEQEAKPYSLNSCLLCDVKNWGGKEPKDRYYSETKLIGFMANFAQQETELLSKHLLEMQKTNGALTDRVNELEKQIEKMKCCYNCKHSRTDYEHCKTRKHEKWEMIEK